MNFFAGFIVSFVSYWLLNKAFPVPARGDTWNEVGERIVDLSLARHGHDDEYTGKESETAEDVETGSVKSVDKRESALVTEAR